MMQKNDTSILESPISNFFRRVVGCRGGVGILRGYHNLSRSQRSNVLIVQKYQDSIMHHRWFKTYRGLFKLILDFVGFTYVLRSSTIIQDLLRFHHPAFPFYSKQSRLKIVLDPPRNHFSNVYAFLVSHRPTFSKFWIPKMLRFP